jgi:hypothetical protein
LEGNQIVVVPKEENKSSLMANQSVECEVDSNYRTENFDCVWIIPYTCDSATHKIHATVEYSIAGQYPKTKLLMPKLCPCK